MIDLAKIEYRVSELAFRIAEAAITGMLFEVSTSPSPGLVSPISSGAHKDMDFFTFMRSTPSLTQAMALCAQAGIQNSDDILTKIREVGIAAEKHMLEQTKGINTQRGILFAAGIVAAATGACARLGVPLDREQVSIQCKEITAGIVERELKHLSQKNKLTNGEKVFVKYGISGIRGEMESGLPSVITTGLPLFETALLKGIPLKDALAHTLIGLMSVAQDTVVINRAGIQGLFFMHDTAKKAMELGGMLTRQGRDSIAEMEEQFIERNISPGGAADLLAISVMLYEIEKIIV